MVDARYVLFLNPDTEIAEGTFAELIGALDERPTVGLAGVRQISPDGSVHPTMRRFPNALRTLGDALGFERLPRRPGWLGERILDRRRYELESDCDWTIGSFLFTRREALEGAGALDERFFIYSEETDLCLRIRESGWEIRHLPLMTIVHHVSKGGTARTIDERMVRQATYASLQYAGKHFSPPHRVLFRSALLVRHLLRAAAPARDAGFARRRRQASLGAIKLLVGVGEPPFAERTLVEPLSGPGRVAAGLPAERRTDGVRVGGSSG
jgi:GT2 family glycosyltransferase